MATLSLAGIDNFDLGGLDEDLFFAVYSTLTLPGFVGVEITSLGNGRTQLFLDFGGQQLGAVVRNYQGSAATGMTGGVIESVLVYSEGTAAGGDAVWAEGLNIRVTDLISAATASGAALHFGPVASLIWKQGWTLIGDNAANQFQYEDEVGTYGNVGVFSGHDRVFGRGGDDLIELYAGNDLGAGGAGDDILRGGRGHDTLRGNQGSDLLSGGGGHDTLDGGSWSDRLVGGNGNDVLFGRGGNDRVLGGGGADVLRGDGGDDVLHGGGGADTFVFSPNAGADRINDFDPARDTIRFNGIEGIRITDTGNGLRITHSDGTIDLIGIEPGEITAGDILGW